MKSVYLGADHAGFELKQKIKHWLERKKIPYEDRSNLILNPLDDYPDVAARVAHAVVKHKTIGILICGSAQGMCIAANKVKGIRAVVPFSLKEARLAREHEDANIICLSGWFFRFYRATKLLENFLMTRFSGEEKHKRRIAKIARLERA